MTSINKSKYYISGIILVFIVFYLFLLAQFSKVFIYYDDYGYLSLSYAYDSTEIYGDNYDRRDKINTVFWGNKCIGY